MKNFKPKANYVLIRFQKKSNDERKTKSGLVLPQMDNSSSNVATPSKYDFIVQAVGPDVKTINVGDYVIFNEYDMKGLQDDEDVGYGICKEESVFATYEN